jgi:virginiamycin B lyase
MWFTELLGPKIGRITTTGSVTEFPVTYANAAPNGITTGPDNALWFTDLQAERVGRMTTSGSLTSYPVLTSEGWDIVTGPDGNLWFGGYNSVGFIVP